MNKTTAAALESSIEHWTRLSEGIANPGEAIHSDDCALCQKFNPDFDSKCEGCPVYVKSGMRCGNFESFWFKAYVALHEHHIPNSTPEFLEAAKNMLNFLISLREPITQ